MDQPPPAAEPFNGAEFTSLACLVSLRAKGQQVFNEEHSSVGEDSLDDVITELDTEHPALLGKCVNNDLKRRFLDRLAEIISHRKGGGHVASTALVEDQDSATVYVAKNDGFSAAEMDGLQSLFQTLSVSASGCCSKGSSRNLLTSLLDYSKDRLDHHYIPKLRQNLERFRHNIPMPDVSEEEIIAQNIGHGRECVSNKDWQSTIQDPTSHALGTLSAICDSKQYSNSERRLLLSSKAHEIRHISSFRGHVRTHLGDSATEELLRSIYFLGRIRAAFETFRLCRMKIGYFDRMGFYAILPPDFPSSPIESCVTVAQALCMTGLDCHLSTIQKHINRKTKLKQLEISFEQLQKQALTQSRLHAEVQVLMATQQVTQSSDDLFPYLGCSKLSCYLCSRLVQAYGLTTRGCHGRLYERWRVPTDLSLLIVTAKRPLLVAALRKVREEMIQIIRTPIGNRMARVAESSAGCTVHTDMGDTSRHTGMEDIQDRMRWFDIRASKMEQDLLKAAGPHDAQIGLPDARDGELQDFAEHPRLESSASSPNPNIGSCKACLKPTSQTCDMCHNEWMCSRKCEQEIMINHIFRCSPNRPLDSADYLVKACHDEVFPDDPQTREDFGFHKVCTQVERNRLLFLYECLVRVAKWDSRKIHTWRSENQLATEMRRICQLKMSNPLIDACFSWFLANEHLVDTSTPAPTDTEIVESFYQPAGRHIGLEDTSVDSIMDDFVTWGNCKQTAFRFYARILLGFDPSPDSQEWMLFGFCACSSSDSRGCLIFLYRMLIDRCSFEEFCTATESSNVFRLLCEYLFERKTPKRASSISEAEQLEHVSCGERLDRLEDLEAVLPHLQYVLGRPQVAQGAVWYLKRFTLSDECYPNSVVVLHYGLFNCQDAIERLELKTAYKRLLADNSAGDPIELQTACLANKIYEYASSKIQLDNKFKRLMRNLNKEDQSAYVIVTIKRKVPEEDQIFCQDEDREEQP